MVMSNSEERSSKSASPSTAPSRTVPTPSELESTNQCYTRWTVRYDCVTGFGTVSGNNVCIDPAAAYTTWTITGSDSFYCDYTIDVALEIDCTDESECTSQPLSSQPSLPSPAGCTCPSTRCYTRWTVIYDCITGFGPLGSSNVCIEPASAYTSWTITSSGGFSCTYTIDVPLNAACTTSADCSGTSSEPSLPNPASCGCPSTRCFTRWTVTYDCASGFGSMGSSNVCIEPGTAYTTWTVTASGNFYCVYTIDVPLGTACSSSGDCTVQSSQPSLPDPSGCSCPSTRCYTRWTITHDCITGFGSLSHSNVCVEPGSAYTSWTVVGSGNFYCDYAIDVPLGTACSTSGDCSGLSSQPSLPDPSGCSCPSTRCFTRWTVRYTCGCGLGTMSPTNVCIDPGSAYSSWTVTGTGDFCCDYTIDVALGSACNVAGDCATQSTQPSAPDTSGCSCPTTRCYAQWTVRYDCVTGFTTPSSENVCIEPGSAYTNWTVTGSGNFYCDYTIHVPLANCAENVSGGCNSSSDCSGTALAPNLPDPATCACPPTHCYTHWTVVYDCASGFGEMSGTNVCLSPGSALTDWIVTGTTSTSCTYEIDVALGTLCGVDGDCTSQPLSSPPADPNPASCSCPQPTECRPTTICETGDCPKPCPQPEQPMTNSTPADVMHGIVSVAKGAAAMGLSLLRSSALGGAAASTNFDINYYANVECTCTAATQCEGSSEGPALRMGLASPMSFLVTSSTIDRVIGKGFDCYQYARLVELPGGTVKMFTGQHSAEFFGSDGSGGYISSNNTSAVLNRRGGGTSADAFTLVARDGTVSVFFGNDSSIDTPGRLKSITDRFGNRQAFTWTTMDGRPRLLSVTDSYGRVTTFSYYGVELGHMLKEVTDFDNRQVSFQYDELAHLVAVVLPSITRGADGNANVFPNGTAYVFQYDIHNPRPERRDDLIKVYYPNEVAPYLDDTRTVNVVAVEASAQPRTLIQYGQDPTQALSYGRVISQTLGDPINGVGGTSFFSYSITNLPDNLIDDSDPIVSRTTINDRNDNLGVYDFNAAGMAVRQELFANRGKNSLQGASWVTWTKYNSHNQPLLIVMPEGNSVAYTYEDETNTIQFSGIPYGRRIGLLKSMTRLPGNTLGIPSRPGSGPSGAVQNELTVRQFSDPIFNRVCASIDERGNAIDVGLYFPPQNLGTTPTNADRSRYATITYYDYQKDLAATVQADTSLQDQLVLNSTQIGQLITFVNNQMIAATGTGGIPAGFEMGVGDVNGEGTGNGTAIDARHQGAVVKIKRPIVMQLIPNFGAGDPWLWQTQDRIELFTSNSRGQQTTATDAEGNLTLYIRYPENDPEGAGQFLVPTLSNQQYGFIKEIHVDADPDTVMSLIGSDGDMITFIGNLITRTNTPGTYLDLVTRYQSSSSAGCTSCAYDPLGNPLSKTDPRGVTTTYDLNEIGQVYRTTTDAPYSFKVETHYDANGNVIRVDTEDKQVLFDSMDPADAGYGHFTPSGDGAIANVPMQPGPGGAVRPGWFTNLFSFNILNDKIEEDIDATGSVPANLVTRYTYDPNQNLIQITKPMGNIVEYDYDERDLRIATRTGYDPDSGEEGSITAMVYDGNGNLLDTIAPIVRGGIDTELSVTINDAFRSDTPLTHTGDWALENTYDGFDRVTKKMDAVGGVTLTTFDPGGRAIATITKGTAGGFTPGNRLGTNNVPLSSGSTRFDEAGRAYEQQQDVFLNTGISFGSPTHNLPSSRSVTHTGGGLDANSTTNTHTATATLTSGGGSYVLSRSVYDRAGRTTAAATDNGAITSYTYDGANRQISMSDPLGNIVQNAFDGNGNIVASTRIEKCTISYSIPAESFDSQMRYDLLNRLVVQIGQGPDAVLNPDMGDPDNQTLFTLLGYDSRGNRSVAIDPKRNSTVLTYDGASRQLENIRQLRTNGDGAEAIFETVTTATSFDRNGRMIRLIDDNGGTTLWSYDTLDRQTVMTFHDGSTRVSSYDAGSALVEYTDENGSVFDYIYDSLSRRQAVGITHAAGVGGTTAQAFQYDGLSRTTFARDAIGGSNADVAFKYDSLGRVIEEGQTFNAPTQYVTRQEWVSFVDTQQTFASGRQITNGYDELYRRNIVTETSGGTPIAVWQFFGGRTALVNLANGITCSFMNNAQNRSAIQAGLSTPGWGDKTTDRLGYDGSGRLIAKRFLPSGSTTSLVGFTTAYDPSSNKLYERALHAESRSALYPAYDSMDRLLQYQRGVLATGGGSVTTPITLPGTDSVRTYNLDSLGNWKNTVYTPEGAMTPTTEIRQHNKLNEITQFAATPVLYDHGNNNADPNPRIAARGNGNIANDGTRIYGYDALNRLIAVYSTVWGTPLVGSYAYDALGRRIFKVVTNGGISGSIAHATYRYIYDGNQIVEELTGTNVALRQFVWGQYIDELIQLKVPTTTTTPPLTAGVYFPLQDLLYRTTALTNLSGTIVEACDYDAYGNTLMYSGPGTDGIWFTNDDMTVLQPACEYLFTGRQYDPETRLYSYRARYYDSGIGRFLSRDARVYRDSECLYAYVLGNPVVRFDPMGLETSDKLDKVIDSILEISKTSQEGPDHARVEVTEPKGCNDKCDRQVTSLIKQGPQLQSLWGAVELGDTKVWVRAAWDCHHVEAEIEITYSIKVGTKLKLALDKGITAPRQYKDKSGRIRTCKCDTCLDTIVTISFTNATATISENHKAIIRICTGTKEGDIINLIPLGETPPRS